MMSLIAILLGVAAILCICALCVGLILHQGTVPLELEPFAIVYGLLLFPVILGWNAFVAFLYALTRNRFATYSICLGAMLVVGIQILTGEMTWVWNWSLAGALTWTDLGPFEMDRVPLLLNRLMVLGAGLLLLVLTVRIFPRREFDSTRIVLRLRPGALTRSALFLSPLILVPLGLGIALQRGEVLQDRPAISPRQRTGQGFTSVLGHVGAGSLQVGHCHLGRQPHLAKDRHRVRPQQRREVPSQHAGRMVPRPVARRDPPARVLQVREYGLEFGPVFITHERNPRIHVGRIEVGAERVQRVHRGREGRAKTAGCMDQDLAGQVYG